jgi:protein-S-isoprenylcysteine O-methyltransferase Ste14
MCEGVYIDMSGTSGNDPFAINVYNVMVITIEVLISFVCLASLIVVLLEASRVGGLQRRWQIGLWAFTLLALAVLALLRVLVNLDAWSDGHVLLGYIGVVNFVVASALLVRWLFWARPTSGASTSRRPEEGDTRERASPLP